MKGSITMKKTTFTKSAIAVLSAAVMTALSATPAFAVEFKTENFLSTAEDGTKTVKAEADLPTSTGDVKIVIDADSAAPTDATEGVYRVTVEWESLEFTYSGGTWDTTNLNYSGGTWSPTEDDIPSVVVTNYSNWGVNYSAAFIEAEGVTVSGDTATKYGVTATMSGDVTKALSACPVGAEEDEIPSGTFKVGVAGTPTVDENFTLDTIKVTLTPHQDN